MDYRKCRNPGCFRKVIPGALYCCGPCADAHASTCPAGPHAGWCDDALEERGTFSMYEAAGVNGSVPVSAADIEAGAQFYCLCHGWQAPASVMAVCPQVYASQVTG